jgi:dTDP-4-dehydrorhamnose reductase
MKLLIIGSGGRLGASLVRNYQGLFGVAGLRRPEIDLCDPERLRDAVIRSGCDVAINCAAQTDVDFCETHREEAFAANATGVRAIAEACRELGARLIHISTDYVFDGNASEPYREEDPAHPISVYGESKLAGEQEALDVSDRNLVVRVSWVFGPERPSFVDAMLRQAKEKEDLAAVADKFAAPTYTEDAAELLLPLIREPIATGFLHLCNRGVCSWQEYGEAALTAAARHGAALRTTRIRKLALAELDRFVARRPVYSAMSTAKYESITGRAPRPWEEAVDAYTRLLVETGKL